jgi:hypothetical protein
VLDEAGAVVLEQCVSTTAKALREAFSSTPHSRIALEGGALPLGEPAARRVGTRSDRGASDVRLIRESREKDDRQESIQLLCPVKHRSASTGGSHRDSGARAVHIPFRIVLGPSNDGRQRSMVGYTRVALKTLIRLSCVHIWDASYFSDKCAFDGPFDATGM